MSCLVCQVRQFIDHAVALACLDLRCVRYTYSFSFRPLLRRCFQWRPQPIPASVCFVLALTVGMNRLRQYVSNILCFEEACQSGLGSQVMFALSGAVRLGTSHETAASVL